MTDLVAGRRHWTRAPTTVQGRRSPTAKRSGISGDGLKFAARSLARQGRGGHHASVAGAVIRLCDATTRAAGRSRSCRRPRRRSSRCGPRDGAILALVGGFDFDRNKFNHVTQAQRQPGSAFKPFIYSAALEKGFTPATVVNDAPLLRAGGAGRRRGLGAEELRRQVRRARCACARRSPSRRTSVTVRVLQAIGAAVRAGLHRALRLRPEAASAVPDDGVWAPARRRRCRWSAPTPSSPTAAIASRRTCIARIDRRRGNVLSEAKPVVAGETARARDRSAQRVRHDVRCCATSCAYGTATRAHVARPQRPRRQDRDDQRERRRVVLRLQRAAWSASRGSASTSRRRSAPTRPAAVAALPIWITLHAEAR